jgi:hypothetical protein
MKWFRFPGMLVSSMVAFLILLGFLIHSMMSRSEQDVELYQKLVNSENPNRLDKMSPSYKAKQRRQSLQKEAFFNRKNERLQLRLTSSDAELVLDCHDGGTEVVEHMNNVRCCIQEELFYKLPDGHVALLQEDGRLLVKHGDPRDLHSWTTPQAEGVVPMQKIRVLEAASASYYYERDLFEAENVKISQYILTGHQLPDQPNDAKPIMRGTAQWVRFTLSEGDYFKAHQLKARFYPSENL